LRGKEVGIMAKKKQKISLTDVGAVEVLKRGRNGAYVFGNFLYITDGGKVEKFEFDPDAIVNATERSYAGLSDAGSEVMDMLREIIESRRNDPEGQEALYILEED
jgi:hypothetical protein